MLKWTIFCGIVLALLWLTTTSSAVRSRKKSTNPRLWEQPLEYWKIVAHPIYWVGYKESYDEMIRHLLELVEIEKQVDKTGQNILENPNKGKTHTGIRTIQYYLERWEMVVRSTSLNRKRRTLTQNLLDFLTSDSNECTVEEFNNLRLVFSYFITRDGLKETLSTALFNKRLLCQERIYNAILNPFKLIGVDDVTRVLELQILGEFDCSKRVRCRRFGTKLGPFLADSGHPSMDTLNPFEMGTAYRAIENAYLGEVFEPSSKVCALGSVMLEKFKLKTYFIRDSNDYRSVELNNIKKTIKAACSIIKFDVALVVPDIIEYLRIMYQSNPYA